MAAEWIETGHRVARAEEALQAIQGAHQNSCPRTIARRSKALERYLMYFGGDNERGDASCRCSSDLADLLEQSCGGRNPIREIVGRGPGGVRGDVPPELPGGQWINKERERLTNAIDRAAGDTGKRRPTMTTQVQAAIHVQGLEKSYKKLEVLRGVDFDVERGSIFALLGSNGAGKTTVVKILSTLLKADAGTASVNGFDVATQAADVRESISLTGQFAAVDEILSGRENLVLVAQLRHLKDPGTIADDLLERFALTDAAARKVSTYSGGMRRRLDIAMSLIGNPQVIFLDEPTTGLDPEARIEVWQAVKELAEHGTTVLLTTQYLDEAEQLADRIAILHEGRIIVNGTLTELKQLLPPAKVEYVEKQPTLEDVFFAIVGDDGKDGDAGNDRSVGTDE